MLHELTLRGLNVPVIITTAYLSRFRLDGDASGNSGQIDTRVRTAQRASGQELEHLPEQLFKTSATSSARRRVVAFAFSEPAEGELEALRDVERRHIRRMLQHTQANKAHAARLLGVSQHQLYVKLERLGIVEW